jgi:hypothetical protein
VNQPRATAITPTADTTWKESRPRMKPRATEPSPPASRVQIGHDAEGVMQGGQVVRQHGAQHAQQHIEADLGQQPGIDGGQRGGQDGVAVGQPEIEREQTGLEGEHAEQHKGQHGQARVVDSPASRIVQHGVVERAGQGIEQTGRADEERAADQVEGEVGIGLLDLPVIGLQGEQGVGRDQHHFKTRRTG